MTDPHIARREEVMAWLDGELGGERADAARAHLASCAECAALAGEWQKAATALSAWQVEASPDRMAVRVLEAAAKGPESRRAWAFPLLPALSQWSLVAATVAAVVVGSVIVLRVPGWISDSRLTVPEALNTEQAPNAPATVPPPPVQQPAPERPAVDRETRGRPTEGPGAGSLSRRAPADTKKPAEGTRAETADATRPQGQTFRNAAPPAAAAVSAAPPPPPPPAPVATPPPPAAPPATMAETVAKPPIATTTPTQPSRTVQSRAGGGGRGGGISGLGYIQSPLLKAGSDAPAIVRHAELAVVVERFDDARPAIERIVQERSGAIGSLDVATESATPRTIVAVLRIPVASYEAALNDLRRLGKVSRESQSSDDISAAVRDLGARLTTARQQETRLRDLLQRRGELNDVLAVERELARVRSDIERMEAEARANADRVALATITLRVEEGYRAALLPESDSIGRRISNAFVDGWRAAFDRVVELMIGVLQVTPTLVLWGLLAVYPYRLIRRRTRLGPRGSNLPA
ncbi:MAG TPA: DUF4349 domain-containing protein [Vicinamibacterales bacterium]|nr:DUF4349 domain-containing protein [Vicinamibacterales bacterium]